MRIPSEQIDELDNEHVHADGAIETELGSLNPHDGPRGTALGYDPDHGTLDESKVLEVTSHLGIAADPHDADVFALACHGKRKLCDRRCNHSCSSNQKLSTTNSITNLSSM